MKGPGGLARLVLLGMIDLALMTLRRVKHKATGQLAPLSSSTQGHRWNSMCTCVSPYPVTVLRFRRTTLINDLMKIAVLVLGVKPSYYLVYHINIFGLYNCMLEFYLINILRAFMVCSFVKVVKYFAL